MMVAGMGQALARDAAIHSAVTTDPKPDAAHPAGEQLGGWRLCGRDRERDRTDEPTR